MRISERHALVAGCGASVADVRLTRGSRANPLLLQKK
jgi:hypothetical protein